MSCLHRGRLNLATRRSPSYVTSQRAHCLLLDLVRDVRIEPVSGSHLRACGFYFHYGIIGILACLRTPISLEGDPPKKDVNPNQKPIETTETIFGPHTWRSRSKAESVRIRCWLRACLYMLWRLQLREETHFRPCCNDLSLVISHRGRGG